MKKIFEISVQDSGSISGGYLLTTAPLTERQLTVFITNLGRELMKEIRECDCARYRAVETGKEIEDALVVGIEVRRSGRGVRSRVSKSHNSWKTYEDFA